MEALLQTTFLFWLTLHIAGGYLSLIAGFILLIRRKGDLIHRRIGVVFFIALSTVCLSALLMAFIKSNSFLFHLGVFVMFQNYCGLRSVKNKTLTPLVWDYLFTTVALVNALFMLKGGVVVLMVFGLISLLLVAQEIQVYWKQYRKLPISSSAWLRRHIGMMMGAFIGTLTAFIVVNFHFSPAPWLLWLAPTIVFIPLMRWFTHRYQKLEGILP